LSTSKELEIRPRQLKNRANRDRSGETDWKQGFGAIRVLVPQAARTAAGALI
jgi:hypothetical protein